MNKIKLLLALMALALPTMAKAERIPTYVAIATWTAGGSTTKAFAFQNTSSTRDVVIIKIALVPTTSGTVTSGPMNFYVYASTNMTHGGLSQVSAGSYNTPNWTAPSFVSVSTGPTNVVYENKDTYQLPLTIIGANPDETGTPLMNVIDNGVDLPAEDQGIVLPKGQNRGIVIEQKQFGASDYTAGTMAAKIIYIIR